MSEIALTKRRDQRSIDNLGWPSLEILFYVDSTPGRQYMRALYFLQFRNQLPTMKKNEGLYPFLDCSNKLINFPFYNNVALSCFLQDSVALPKSTTTKCCCFF